MGNRSLVFHVVLGPGISTALRRAAPVSSLSSLSSLKVCAWTPSFSFQYCSYDTASSRGGSGLGAPTARAALEQVSVVEQPVEHGADGGGIAEQLAPVLDRTV